MSPAQKKQPSATSFPGLADRSLNAIARDIALDRSPLTSWALVKRLGDDRDRAAAVLWHLVAHGLIPADRRHTYSLLEPTTLDVARAERLANFLRQIPEVSGGVLWPNWLGNRAPPVSEWSGEQDHLVYEAMKLAPQAFAQHERDYASQVKTGVALVRGRLRLQPSSEACHEVIAQLARGEASGYGMSSIVDMPYLSDSGHQIDHRLNDVESVRQVALLFGSEAEWDRAYLDAIRRNEWRLICNALPALRQMTLEELVTHLRARLEQRTFGDDSDMEALVVRLFDQRGDGVEALQAAAEGIADDAGFEALDVRRRLAQAALRACLAQGRPAPATLASLAEAP